MSGSTPSRKLAAALFASVGFMAATAHVLASDAENLRLWREVLPLAALVGAVLGALFRPAGWLQGALTACVAVFVFAIAYSVAETVIYDGQNEIARFSGWAASIFYWMGVVLSEAAIGGIVATLAGGSGGFWLRRQSSRNLN